MINEEKPDFMFGNEKDEKIKTIIDRIDEKIRELSSEEDTLEEDDSDCEDDLFEDNYEEDKKGQVGCNEDKLGIFPDCASILGSIVNQSMATQEYDQAHEYFDRLRTIPIKKHGFNTLIVEIKYMLTDSFNNEKQIRKYIGFLKSNYPKREEGFYYEAILEYRLGKEDKALSILVTAAESCKSAPRSLEMLTYEMLKAGEYIETIKYADLALMFTSIEPVINTAKVRLSKCLAQDSILLGKVNRGEEISLEEINNVRLDYVEIRDDPDFAKYEPIIRRRIAINEKLKRKYKRD